MGVTTWIIIGAVVLGVILLFMLLKWILSLRTVVPTTEVHVVRTSRNTKVYGAGDDSMRLAAQTANAQIQEGTTDNSPEQVKDLVKPDDFKKAVEKAGQISGNVYYNWPESLPVLGVTVAVRPLSIFTIKIDGYDAYDKERVPFVVDVLGFFRISNYMIAATRVSSVEELKDQLYGICRGAIRAILANEPLESIMGERAVYGKKFTEAVEEQLLAWGVSPVKAIELMDVRDAEGEHVVENIMKKRISAIERDSRKEVAKNNQEAQEAEIAADKEVNIKKALADKEVGEKQAETEQAVGSAKEKAQQQIKEQAKTTAEKTMDVERVKTVQAAEINKEKVRIDAEAEQKKVEIEAEAAKKQTELRAEADLTKATKNAEGIKAEGEAKAAAEEKMQLASVTAQTTLAKAVGENEPYQRYLIEVKKVEANQAVGIEQAKALEKAGIKIVATGGDGVTGGLNKALELFSGKGGASLASALETFAGTDAGAALLQKIGIKVGGDTQPKKVGGDTQE